MQTSRALNQKKEKEEENYDSILGLAMEVVARPLKRAIRNGTVSDFPRFEYSRLGPLNIEILIVVRIRVSW